MVHRFISRTVIKGRCGLPIASVGIELILFILCFSVVLDGRQQFLKEASREDSSRMNYRAPSGQQGYCAIIAQRQSGRTHIA